MTRSRSSTLVYHFGCSPSPKHRQARLYKSHPRCDPAGPRTHGKAHKMSLSIRGMLVGSAQDLIDI